MLKSRKYSRFTNLVILLVALSLLPACEGLQDPMKDRETGDNINLLIVDFNFFKTHITVNVLDAKSNQRVEVPVTLTFSGKNGDDIVTYSGNKKPFFEVLNGRMELTIDPGKVPSPNNPVTFGVKAEAEGFQIATVTETYLSEGNKVVDIFLSKETDGNDGQIGGDVEIGDGDTSIVFGIARNYALKSASVESPAWKVQYSMSLQNFLKLKDENGNFLFASSAEFLEAYNANKEGFLYMETTTFNNHPSRSDVLEQNGTTSQVILQVLETGTITGMVVGGVRVGQFNGAIMTAACSWTSGEEPDTWGFAAYAEDRWLLLGKNGTFSSLPYSYTLISALAADLCQSGAVISFNAGFQSGFSITADVLDENGKFIYTQYFTGNFPASFTLENVPSMAAKMVFRDDNPSFKPIPDLDLASLCSGNHSVTVLPQDGYSGYQMVLKAFCPDNMTIAVAPTYSGEYRLSGTDDPWQKGFMQGGILNLLGLPDKEYEYRLLWENEWEITHFFTTFNEDGSYPYESDSHITSERLSDGRTRILISHTFRQKVCDTLNW